jgi:hypothetical protein
MTQEQAEKLIQVLEKIANELRNINHIVQNIAR